MSGTFEGIEVGKKRLQFVDMSPEEMFDVLTGIYEKYVDESVRDSCAAYREATVPEYKENILRILGMKVKKVHTERPMTRVGLNGYLIASRVLPAVWEAVGGDEEKYRSFFEECIVPLGVKSGDIAGFPVEKEAKLC